SQLLALDVCLSDAFA
ncbi:DUF645 family protein, partial [Vibrio cholerae]